MPNFSKILIAFKSRDEFVFSVSHRIITLLLNKSFRAAIGPENSVPAIGWEAKKLPRLLCVLTELQIWYLVDPKSITNVSLDILSRIILSCFLIDSTGIARNI